MEKSHPILRMHEVCIFFLLLFYDSINLKTSNALMSTMRHSMNDFIELAKEESAGALASKWEDLEKERTEMRDAYRKK